MVYRKKDSIYFCNCRYADEFLDLLTYPLYTWAFPLLLLILLSEDGQKALNYVKTVVVSGLGWILGYAGMWFGKWALAGWIVHRNVIQEAWKEVLFRSGSEESLNLIARLEALYDNWKHYEYPLYTALLAIWLTWFIYKSLNGKTQIVRQEKNGAYLLITLSSFVWYFVLANHTLGHHFLHIVSGGWQLQAFYSCSAEALSYVKIIAVGGIESIHFASGGFFVFLLSC